ncbi:chromatin assembly factor 1 subunit B [Kwoniella heveanensis CBS 569]|nr:chromatin assembly factor 1 subunit B [Kwoniella heveanensis CBS 569]
MRPKVLEISWHETQAVYSCDFQPLPPSQLKRLLSLSTANPSADEDDKPSSSSAAVGAGSGSGSGAGGSSSAGPVVAGGRQYRLATAGGDSKVRLWMIHPNIPSVSTSTHAALTGQEITQHPPRAEYLTTLSKHTAAVNVVRFSPNGQTLASAGDDGNVILWVSSDKPIVTFGESADELPDKEHWRSQRMLQVTTKHVYDLSWSPDGEFIIAGSTDNTATIWKASTGECVFALREHTHNVQGVSWDPLNEYIATQSSDRTVHVNTFAFRNNVPEVHPVSRATRMEIRHSRTPSFPSSTRPNLARRASTTSETGSVITTTSELPDPIPVPAHHQISSSASAGPAPATPSTSVPSTPQPAAAAMNPPATSNRPGSRRSSFSGSQAAASPSLSAAAFPGRAGRSPSPIPPLPAIRAPPTSTSAILQRLYGEEGVTRFFRRLTFSPDGSLLLTPAGQIEDQIFKGSPMLSTRSLSQDTLDREPNPAGGSSSVPKPKNVDNGKPTVYIYSRANLARAPIAHLPGHKTAAVAIRFSPVFYDLRTGSSSSITSAEPKQITLDRNDNGPVHVSLSMPPPPPPEKDDKEKEKPLGSVFALPYRLLYAVACQDSVLLYDTQQASPIAIFKGLHYAGFTDVAWSPDGQALMLSSSDGYCSIVVFDPLELGTVHPTQQHHRQLAAIAQSHSHSSHPAIATPLSHHSGSAAATPVPHSPAISVARQSPAPQLARHDREGSTASSVMTNATAPSGHPSATATSGTYSLPPFGTGSTGQQAHRPPSSVASASSADPILPTPGEEVEGFSFRSVSGASVGMGKAPSIAGSEASSTTMGLGLGVDEIVPVPGTSVKRSSLSGGDESSVGGEHGAKREEQQPKKKRRIALTQVTGEE